MFEQKINNSNNDFLKKAHLIIISSKVYKHRIDILRIIFSGLNVCANILFVTRMRLPLLGNICFNSNYDAQYGCNSVFKNQISQETQAASLSGDGSIDSISRTDVLSFAEKQVGDDSQSGLNILRLISPFYLLIFLCQGFKEITTKKARVDLLAFVLVLITVSDLLLFNSTYSFSSIKPNHYDIQLFNSAMYSQNIQRTHNQNSLQDAQNLIFLQTSRVVILFSFLGKIIATLITSYKFYISINSLTAFSWIGMKVSQQRRSSATAQSKLNNEQNISNQVKFSNQNAKNNTSVLSKNKSQQKINSSHKKQRNEKNPSSQAFQNLEQEVEMIEESGTKSQQSNIAITNNKKTKSVIKKIEKRVQHKQLQNSKQNIQISEMNDENDDTNQQLFRNQKNEKTHQETEINVIINSEIIDFYKCEDQKEGIMQRNKVDLLMETNINSNSGSNELKEYQQSNIKPELQSELIPSLSKQDQLTSANESATSNQIIQIQIQNNQKSKEFVQNVDIIKYQNNSVTDKSKDTYNCSEIQNTGTNSPQFESTISPLCDSTQMSSINNRNSSPDTYKSVSLTSYDASEFLLSESVQNHSYHNNPSITTSQTSNPCIVITNEYQEQHIQNGKSNSSTTNILQNGEQVIIEQINEDLRKKWAIRQKQMKLEKKKLATSMSYNPNTLNTFDINNQSIAYGNAQYNQIGSFDMNVSQHTNNSSNFYYNSSTHDHQQQQHQEDLDISTNDESNFASINSNYDASSITKQNRNEHPMNLKNLSQHLLNQQVATAIATQRGQQQQQQHQQPIDYSKQQQQQNDISSNNETVDQPQDISAYYQNYQNAQYQEEQCYNNHQINRTCNTTADPTCKTTIDRTYKTSTNRTCKNSTDRTSKNSTDRTCDQESISSKFDRQNLYFEDDYQKTSQMCFEQFIRLNKQNNQDNLQQQLQSSQLACPQKQSNSAYGFNYDDEACDNAQGKTPFELFYDQQCMMDEEEYDEEEELDQCHEDIDEEEEDDDEDDDEDEDDDDDDDDEDERELNSSYNKKSVAFAIKNRGNGNYTGKSYTELQEMGHNQEQMKLIINNNHQLSQYLCNNQSTNHEDNSENSTFLQSNLHQNEIFSVDELKSHLGDYLDMLNDENSILHQCNEKGQKFDSSLFSSMQESNFDENGLTADDGKKKKKKKKKSQEQKRKRRSKRKMKKKLERTMIESDLEGPIQPTTLTQTKQNLQNTPNLASFKKNNNQKSKKQLNSSITGNEFYKSTCNKSGYSSSSQYNQNYSSSSLKRLLDENLLEYFTFTVVLSQGLNINIYITDFYQFDEQFEMQSRVYGIDDTTILDTKLSLIFEIMSGNLYPAMTPFFEHLTDTYSMAKISSCINSVQFTLPQFTQDCTPLLINQEEEFPSQFNSVDQTFDFASILTNTAITT